MKHILCIVFILFCAQALSAHAQNIIYDEHNRVVAVDYGNDVTITYRYDKVGNRKSQIVTEVNRHAIIYDSNDHDSGTVPVDPTMYAEGELVTVLGNTGNLVRTGNTFVGWNTQADGQGTDRPVDSTFIMPAADVTLYAKWTQATTHTVTPSAGPNGSIAPDTPQQVDHGQSAIFTITPDPGYTASVGGTCGGTLVDETYTTNPITGSCNVMASFIPNTHTVTPSAGPNGTIAPETPQTVPHGQTTTFIITPDPGYTTTVGGTCGGTLVGDTYTTSPIVEPCSVTASFAQDDPGIAFPEEVRHIVAGAKLLSKVSYPGLSADLPALISSGYRGAQLDSGFAVWETTHAEVQPVTNNVSASNWAIPMEDVLLRYVLKSDGTMYIAAYGDDPAHVISLLTGGFGTEPYNVTIEPERRGNVLEHDVPWTILTELANAGHLTGLPDSWYPHLSHNGNFALFNGYPEDIHVVFSAVTLDAVNQGSWVDDVLAVWCPLNGRVSGSGSRSFAMEYDSPLASFVLAIAHVDNGNSASVKLDGNTFVQRSSWASNTNSEANIYPESVEIIANTTWSVAYPFFSMAILGGEVSISNVSQNPAGGLSNNRAPFVLVLPGTGGQQQHTVTFKDHDGTVLKTEQVSHGGSATAPSDPVREGYIFTGWDKEFSNVMGNLEVFALYQEAAFLFEETWNSGSIDVNTWQSWGTPQPKVVAGGHNDSHAFDPNGDGWCDSGIVTTQSFSLTPGLTIEWMGKQEGFGHHYQDFYVGLASGEIQNDVCAGEGWNTLIRFGTLGHSQVVNGGIVGRQGYDGWSSPFSDTGWHAYKMIINSDATVSFYLDGELAYQSTDTLNLDIYSNLRLVIGGRSAYSYPSLIDNLTIRNAFETNQHTVRFLDHDGTVLKTEQVRDGESATAPDAPVRAGYTFTGWDKGFSNVTESMDVNALYEAIVDGSLQTTIEPQAAIDAGAQWRRMGTTEWLDSGHTEHDLTPQGYTVEFKTIPGWDNPANAGVTVNLAQTALAQGLYVENTNTYDVTAATASQGGSVTGSGTFVHNTWVTLTAVPDSGYEFLHWTEDGQVVSTDADLSFLATKGRDLEAHFRRIVRFSPGTIMLLLE